MTNNYSIRCLAFLSSRYGTRRNRIIDYNKEIPFEKRPAIGFYDTGHEHPDANAINFKRLRMDQVDEKRRDEEENKEQM